MALLSSHLAATLLLSMVLVVHGNMQQQSSDSSRSGSVSIPVSSRSSSYYYRYSSSDGGSHVDAKCARHREEERRRGAIGNFIPRCDQEGHYSLLQCHGSSGHCWCVDRLSGTEIPGTRLGPGRGERPDCRQLPATHVVSPPQTTVIGGIGGIGGVPRTAPVVNYEEYDLEYRNNYRDRPCEEDRARPRAAVSGIYIPQCDESGTYRYMQCHSSVNECWCVERHSGRERAGSRRSSNRITADMCAPQGGVGREHITSTHVTSGGTDSRGNMGVRVVDLGSGPTTGSQQVYAQMMEMKREFADLRQMVAEGNRMLTYIQQTAGKCCDC